MRAKRKAKKNSFKGRRVIDYRPLFVMQYRNNKTRSTRAMTLVEMILAMAIMAIIFAALVPQLRVIQNSWDSKVGASETLQNGRVLIDHLNRNLSTAARITAVSSSSEANGYIEFLDNDANSVRYDIGAGNYVEFGLIGSLSDLAGPVTKLQFTCYGATDLNTPITDVNSIRSVKVETTLTNPAMLDQDMDFSTQAYIRTNTLPSPLAISKLSEPWLEYAPLAGQEPALCRIDNTHYLCAYAGDLENGWAVVLTVNTGDWTVTRGTPFEFDIDRGSTPALCQIDQMHYLCAYTGLGVDGWAVVLTVDTGNWTISKETPIEYDTGNGESPALCKIDNTHYLCAYEGVGGDGFATILTVDTGNWNISNSTALEYDTSMGGGPALANIDGTHYLCAYMGPQNDGWATVLTVDTGTWTITKEIPFEFDNGNGEETSLVKLDGSHYLCAYHGPGEVGWATVLTVNTGTWAITNETPFEFDSIMGIMPALCKIDGTQYLCAYSGDQDNGWAVDLTIDTGNWSISKGTPFEFDIIRGITPALCQVDSTHYLCAYAGLVDYGYAGVLEVGEQILP